MSNQIHQKVEELLKGIPGTFEAKNGVYCLDTIIAERKVFFTKQRLNYTARYKIDENSLLVTFTEKLEERKSGFGAGGTDDITPGFSFKKSVVRSTTGGLEGAIDEQSTLLGKQYQYSFDYKKVRETIKQVAESQGYAFQYKIWGKL